MCVCMYVYSTEIVNAKTKMYNLVEILFGTFFIVADCGDCFCVKASTHTIFKGIQIHKTFWKMLLWLDYFLERVFQKLDECIIMLNGVLILACLYINVMLSIAITVLLYKGQSESS